MAICMQLLTRAPTQLLPRGHTHTLRQVAPSKVEPHVPFLPPADVRVSLSLLWPVAHFPACLLLPAPWVGTVFGMGRNPCRVLMGAQESRWCVMPCSGPGPDARNQQGHLRTQGECSLFWGSRNPLESGAEPHPCLVKVQVDHGWTLTHPCYFGNARPVPVECWPVPCLLWHLSTQTVPSRDLKGPLGQDWAVSKDCVIVYCLFS